VNHPIEKREKLPHPQQKKERVEPDFVAFMGPTFGGGEKLIQHLGKGENLVSLLSSPTECQAVARRGEIVWMHYHKKAHQPFGGGEGHTATCFVMRKKTLSQHRGNNQSATDGE